MCGIAGFVGKGELHDLRRMVGRLHHRGPDGTGFWHDQRKRIYLGHARLAIIDIETGRQPMWTADQTLGVVFNGEIYNHAELRRELEDRGHVFQTDHSDTEVLLHGYREWGPDLPNHLNGMWAFAVYDVPRGSLFLSRDRFGQKPLFYSIQNNTFVFASELSAVALHPAVTARVSPASLQKYFAYGFIPGPNTLYEATCKLPAGHNLRVNVNDLNAARTKYWDFLIEPFDRDPPHAERDYAERIRELLEAAVKRRLMADVPIGVFLSGGIDSSAIALYATRHKRDIESFSVGFQEESFDESPYARLVSKHLGTRHQLEYLSYDRCRNLLPTILQQLDEPIADGSLAPTYLLCQEARKRVTVALGGDGADELFAGYDPFHALRLADIYSRLVPKPIHQAIRLAAARLPVIFRNMSLEFRLKRTLRGLSYPRNLWNPVWHGCLEPHELEEVLRIPVDIEEVYEDAINYWEGCPADNLIDKTLTFYVKLYLQDNILVKVDRASMMNSLEVRSPFLDIDLVDFARRIPHRMKYRLGRTKSVLRTALATLIPGAVLKRSKKGFGMPIGQWMRDDAFSIPQSTHCDGLNQAMLQRYLVAHQDGARDHRIFLWGLYVFAAGHYGKRERSKAVAEAPPAGAPSRPVLIDTDA